MQAQTHTMILLAGAPGTGKTYTGNIIKQSFSGFVELPLDLIKEHIYDEIGFDDPTEKRALDDAAYERFYQAVAFLMRHDKPIMADYPFSYRQKNALEKLAAKYQYHVITIRLEADLKVLYQRAIKRDIEEPRHLGLMMNHYHRGDSLLDKKSADGLPSFTVFKNRAEERGYQTFVVGSLITLNVNDYAQVDYVQFIEELQYKMNSNSAS
ncbi:AAA family ATPase [Loigolactobacillus binensis]|uniref:UDP-N-acetylglucosamine kinase n=1 Tax=Loigolactobacillus binensis TaxID=2559922 RepID=A0ABW3EE12_9LACO|nr:zeta toxin family protein [Loigolactobacillus binensis]